MRIAIDARMMGAAVSRGIGRYVEELVRAMLDVAPEHRYVLIVRSGKHPFAGHPSVETVVADIPWYGLEEQLRMPRVFRSAKADVVFAPHWNVPLLFRGPLVMTVHDLLLRHEPASAKISTRHPFTRTMKRLGYRVTLASAIRRARTIFVPTEFVKTDAESFYPASRGKVVVTGEGMPQPKTSAIPPDREAPYLLYVGAGYPHKGLQDLFDAWPRIRANHPTLRLKIAGELDVFMRKHKEATERGGLEGVEFLGAVSDDTLEGLYAGATGFVYPSHFEGFGLPPLEALAHGCPVVSSDAGALVETLGKDAAIFFRAGSSDGILAAVEALFRDPESARRSALRAAPQLAGRHDWHEAARRTIAAMGKAVSS